MVSFAQVTQRGGYKVLGEVMKGMVNLTTMITEEGGDERMENMRQSERDTTQNEKDTTQNERDTTQRGLIGHQVVAV